MRLRKVGLSWIKDNQVSTVVPNGAQCASACVIIWGAGAHKSAGVTAKIGVHGAVSMTTSKDGAKVDEAAAGTLFVAKALADDKAPATVVAAVAITPSDDMHWLSADDIVAWGATLIDKDGQLITTTTSANGLY